MSVQPQTTKHASLTDFTGNSRDILETLSDRDDVEVSLGRNPMKDRITITLTVTVDVLTHYICIRPTEVHLPNNKRFTGYSIDKTYSAALDDDATIIEDGVFEQADALSIAQNTVERLTE